MFLQQFPGALLIEEWSGAAELLHQSRLGHLLGLQLGKHRLNGEPLLPDHGTRGLFIVHHDLVDLLTGADPGDHGLDLAVTDQGGSDVDDPRRRGVWYQGLAGFGDADRRKHRVNGVIEAEHEGAMSSVVMVTGPPWRIWS